MGGVGGSCRIPARISGGEMFTEIQEDLGSCSDGRRNVCVKYTTDRLFWLSSGGWTLTPSF